MFERIILEMQQHLPLRINYHSWNGVVLTISGEGGSFNTLSAWRIISHGRVEFACEDQEIDDKIAEVLAAEIVGVSIQGRQITIDPVFLLSNGKCLEIFTAETFEPWFLSFPQGGGTVVAWINLNVSITDVFG